MISCDLTQLLTPKAVPFVLKCGSAFGEPTPEQVNRVVLVGRIEKQPIGARDGFMPRLNDRQEKTAAMRAEKKA